MAKRIQIELPDSLHEAVARRFPDKSDSATVVRAVAKLALAEWAEWFAAENRPRTISALHQSRIRRIYEEPDLYAGKQVRRGILFNRWNIPYGEAAYIERVFSETELPGLIAAAIDAIYTDLTTQLTDWKSLDERDEDQQFSIEVDKYGQQLLQSIMQSVKEEGVDMAPVERSSAVHGYYSYTFIADQAEIVRKRCEDLKKKYSDD